jgi:hypothetical protein
MPDESALEHLIGAYLNQDQSLAYPDLMAGVDDFAKDEPDLAAALPSEIDDVLASHTSEADLVVLMRRLGAGFMPGESGYRGWLTEIADRVRQATGPA